MSALDRARLKAWGGVADLLRLSRIAWTPPERLGDDWVATARGFEGRGQTGVDALAMLCQRAATRRR
jgi:hypothetical protein